MSNNTKLGVGALNNNNGSKNTAIGAYASYKNTVGFSNTSLGVNAGFFNETGDWNTSLGSAALCNNLNGSSNTAIGSNALLGTETLSIGNHNTGVGVQSLEENTGDFNTALGAQSGLDLSGSSYNTYLGAKTNASSQGLNHSTAIGYEAKITDSNQIMMGTTTETVQVPGELDVSGQSTFNTDLNVRGVTVGRGVSTQNTNIVFGRNALENITTAGRSVAIGKNALNSITTQYNNTAVGFDSLKNNTGSNNSALGKDAGLNVNGFDSDNNTFLGAYTDFDNSSNRYEKSTAIGYEAKITDSNQIMMGTTTETVQVPGTLNIVGPAYLTNFVDQNNPNQVVPKSYVDTLASGIVPTQACICATTVNISLTGIPDASNTDYVDLSSIADGSYNILVIEQNNKVENGVYIFTKSDASGSWTRPLAPEPMNTGFDANAAFSFVVSGTRYGKIGLVQIFDPAIVGTNKLEYTEFYQLQVNAGDGLNTTVQSGQLYVNVDTSLNIIEYLDNNGSNPSNDLHLGVNTTGDVIIGKNNINQTTNIQNQANFTNDIIVNGVNIGVGTYDNINRYYTNTTIGKDAFISNTIGENNTILGHEALKNAINARATTAIGRQSLQNVTEASDNTALGHFTGQNITTGSNNIFLGRGADFDSSAIQYNYSVALGTRSKITASNQIMMGRSSETVEIPGTLSYQTYRQPIILSCSIKRNNNVYSLTDSFGFNNVISYSSGILELYFEKELNNKTYKVHLTGGFSSNNNSGAAIKFGVNSAHSVNYGINFTLTDNNGNLRDLDNDDTGIIHVTVYYYP